MIYRFTMNLASGYGKPVHQVIAEHPGKSCQEVIKAMESHDYIEVGQYYYRDGKLDPQGPMILNCTLIGKVDLFQQRGNGDME